jgi:uncharacterized protein (TIGR02453 family)
METFAGWPPAALTFYAGLEADNTKAYFERHRETYERAVREPLELLVAEASATFGPAKVFRPNRDVRFSADKAPYKTAAAAVLAPRPGGGGYYVALSRAGLHVGGGVYELARDQRERFRAAVLRDRPGAALAAITADLEAAGFAFAGPDLKRAPRGVDPFHPRIALLRRTRLAALRAFPPGPDVHDAERARAAVLGGWAEIRPLVEWIDEHVGAAQEPTTAGERVRRS